MLRAVPGRCEFCCCKIEKYEVHAHGYTLTRADAVFDAMVTRISACSHLLAHNHCRRRFTMTILVAF
jgi:hypothetical protein